MKRVVLLAAVAVLIEVGPARAWDRLPWRAPPTLATEAGQAKLVLFGTTRNANEKAETTDFEIEAVLKDHKARKGRRQITLERYVPPTVAGTRVKYLIFFDVHKGKPDAYRGVAVRPNSQVLGYLTTALAVRNEPRNKQGRFFFDHLECADQDVALDAFHELADRGPRELKELAASLPPNRIVRWLRGPRKPPYLLGLYASLLGNCGNKEDGAVLRGLLEDRAVRSEISAQHLFAAYALLDRENGWKYLADALKDGKQPFLVRFAALRAARFLYEDREGAVGKAKIVGALLPLLPQEDIADLAIEDLRKWKRWDTADLILAVRKTRAYKLPVVRRALLRYCLACQSSAAAAAFVVEQRRLDPDTVKDAEELLQIEAEERE
jgi:hypothetical protein